jgi:hypothetical protein
MVAPEQVHVPLIPPGGKLLALIGVPVLPPSLAVKVTSLGPGFEKAMLPDVAVADAGNEALADSCPAYVPWPEMLPALMFTGCMPVKSTEMWLAVIVTRIPAPPLVVAPCVVCASVVVVQLPTMQGPVPDAATEAAVVDGTVVGVGGAGADVAGAAVAAGTVEAPPVALVGVVAAWAPTDLLELPPHAASPTSITRPATPEARKRPNRSSTSRIVPGAREPIGSWGWRRAML